MKSLLVLIALASSAFGAYGAYAAEIGSPAWADSADVEEHLGRQLPLDARFTDSDGKPVQLHDAFDGTHPVLLVLAYYDCPQLCSLVLDGATRAITALRDQGFSPSKYRVVTISFDAHEQLDRAHRKQLAVASKAGITWPFWIGDDEAIGALTTALGFHFLRDPRTQAIAHPAVAFVLTPDGKISRYLYGIDYAPRDLRLALLEASDGKTGSFADKILLHCFRYDPSTRRYGLFVERFLRIGAALIFVVCCGLWWLVRREERRRRR